MTVGESRVLALGVGLGRRVARPEAVVVQSCERRRCSWLEEPYACGGVPGSLRSTPKKPGRCCAEPPVARRVLGDPSQSAIKMLWMLCGQSAATLRRTFFCLEPQDAPRGASPPRIHLRRGKLDTCRGFGTARPPSATKYPIERRRPRKVSPRPRGSSAPRGTGPSMVAPPTAPAATTASAIAVRGDVVGSSAPSDVLRSHHNFFGRRPVHDQLRQVTADPELPRTKDRGSEGSPPCTLMSTHIISQQSFTNFLLVRTQDSHARRRHGVEPGLDDDPDNCQVLPFTLNRRVDLHAIDATPMLRTYLYTDSLVDSHTSCRRRTSATRPWICYLHGLHDAPEPIQHLELRVLTFSHVLST